MTRCHGKSQSQAIVRDAYIKAGKTVAIACIGKDGKPHICVVKPFRKVSDE